MSIGKIIDEELELAERAILDGGLIGASLASQIIGVSRQYTYRLGQLGKIQTYNIGGQRFFNAIDCVMYRRKRRQVANYAAKNKLPNLDPASEPRQ